MFYETIILSHISASFLKKKKKKKKILDFTRKVLYNKFRVTGCGSAWLERRLREAEVASSNPATPIKSEPVHEGDVTPSATGSCFI